jgi:hypothetical protein
MDGAIIGWCATVHGIAPAQPVRQPEASKAVAGPRYHVITSSQ